MNIAQLTPQLSASPQILPGDLGAIAAQGFKTLICNRPDGEGADQPTHQELATAAATLGMRLHYLPVASGRVQDASAKSFGELLATSPGPVLATAARACARPRCGPCRPRRRRPPPT